MPLEELLLLQARRAQRGGESQRNRDLSQPCDRPAPASHTPTNHQSLQQAGLPTSPARSSHEGSVAPGFAPYLF